MLTFRVTDYTNRQPGRAVIVRLRLDDHHGSLAHMMAASKGARELGLTNRRKGLLAYWHGGEYWSIVYTQDRWDPGELVGIVRVEEV